MSTKRFSLIGLTGTLLAVMAAGGFVWTFSSSLRRMELFVPRIALGLVVFGGILILLKDILNPGERDTLSRDWVLPYAIGVSLAMWAYGWAFRNIGLMTATFLFLAIWWVWVAYRDARRTGTFARFRVTLAKRLALAVAVAVVVQLIFVTLLRMHLPRTPLP
ncbi:MAG: hypothetical protein EA427_01400 [Spirochaetaceae bacterium]|nr:MAG: hypothetical protein EA427_01400 [Spirochaetaceae bacterium]